ncbi:LysR family transcriptional regulator [Citrobacter freundii]|uniref:LysR family transcriptional regulator n=1 Tax=Citrobacter freundii TaxID=546 RepID=UPI0039780628
MLSLTQLAAYVAIIETGTFQKAAERLGVSQPTVSQSLRNLESYLGSSQKTESMVTPVFATPILTTSWLA